MATLHTINKSPFERNALIACLRVARPGASILLIEDGIYAALQGTKVAGMVSTAMRQLSFYVLAPDLRARGFNEASIINGMQVVDYGGFVDLVVKHDGAQAWL